MIKVDIVSGFLGSGKTTFIRKLLNAYKNEKIVLIENEFGEIGIDGEIIKKDGFEVIELQSGCICCSIKSSFENAISNIVEDIKPNRIVIEPTGIGLLSEIIEMFNKPSSKEKCVINSLTTIVDSIDYFDYICNFGYFFEDQIINASTLILSKTQFINDSQINNIIDSLRKLNSKAYIITEDWDNLSSSQITKLLQGEILVDLDNLYHKKNTHEQMKDIRSISLKTSKIYSKNQLEKILDNLSSGKCGEIVRGKGFLTSDNGCLEFNYINGHYTINNSEFETEGKLCIIGKNLNKNMINILFISR